MDSAFVSFLLVDTYCAALYLQMQQRFLAESQPTILKNIQNLVTLILLKNYLMGLLS
jgi:hypothetical protein